MKRLSLLLCLTLLLALFLPLSPARAEEVPFDGYIVKLSDQAPMLLSAHSAYAYLEHCLVVDSLEEISHLPAEYIEYVEPNYYVELFDDPITETDPPVETPFVPSDTHYEKYQWNLQMTNAMYAYQQGLTGQGVKIGFVDSGINAAHEDLDQSLISGKNFHSDGLDYDQDTYGHGTFSTGIIAAQTNNGKGLAGVAPGAQIMAYRVFDDKSASMASVVNAIYAAIEDGCQIINLSLGSTKPTETLEAAVNIAREKGIILVAAAGNDGTSRLQYPAAYDAVIGVGAVSNGKTGFTVSSFSQRNNSVYVTAPGNTLAGLSNQSATSYELDTTHSSNRGTSFAAPMISGMAALALGYDSDITDAGFRYLLETTSTDKGKAGYDTGYGYGVVNIEAFVKELQRSFAITYELDGGSLPQDAPLTYQVTDDTITLPIPTKKDATFLGWYDNCEFTGDPVTQIPAGSLGDITFHARWQEQKLHVWEDQLTQTGFAYLPPQNDLTNAFPYTADVSAWFRYGDEDLPAEFTPTAQCENGLGTLTLEGSTLTYTPIREELGQTVTIKVRGQVGEEMAPEEVTITLTIQTFTVTFRNLDEVYATRFVQEDGAVPLPDTPQRPGYLFLGWFTQPPWEGGEPFTPEAVITQPLTVYAHWQPQDGCGVIDFYQSNGTCYLLYQHPQSCRAAVALYDETGRMTAISVQPGEDPASGNQQIPLPFTREQLEKASQVRAFLLSDTFDPLCSTYSESLR